VNVEVEAEYSRGNAVSDPVDAVLLRYSVEEFLRQEADLLDHGRFDDWLELLTDDISYRAPLRITRRRGEADVVDGMLHFEENKQSLEIRVRRLGTGVAWAEDPPSRTRRFVTNVHVEPSLGKEVAVRSYLLLYRNRGDDGTHDLLSAERQDILRPVGSYWRLARRLVLIDQTTLGTKNLAVFL